MQDLLDMLLAQPIILIFLAVWLLGGLGRLGQKAARKAVEQQQRAQRRELREAGGRMAEPEPPPVVERTPPRQSPDDIAAEIRRMMGMEDPEPRRPEPEPIIRRVELAESPARPEVAASQLAMQSPTAGRVPTAPVPKGRLMGVRRRRLLDLSNPAAAIIAMEVLGPPRAMRGV